MTADEETSSRPRWFSIKEAAEYLDIGEPTLYRWMRERQITFRKVGDSTRFLKEDLDAAVQVHRSKRELERATGTCPVCKAEDLVEGLMQSTGRIYFKLKSTKFWTLKENSVPTTAKLCRKCGAITYFGDLEQVEALIEEQRRKPQSQKAGGDS
jgi:excisionase family DNA binding protein